MPDFFSFNQGSERRGLLASDENSPLFGRFRAVPRHDDGHDHMGRQRGGRRGGAGGGFGESWYRPHRGSVHVGYGAILAGLVGENGEDEGIDDEDSEDEYLEAEDQESIRDRIRLRARRAMRRTVDLWVSPKQSAVKRWTERWWNRWALLVVLPAMLAVAWCAIPFPQYPLPDDPDHDHPPGETPPNHKVPGHGEARVQVNFWFFLFVYYGFYNLVALVWITKIFNLYSLNWWPTSLGLPLTLALIATVATAVPIPIYLSPVTNWLTIHNTAWIAWTFSIMAMPVAIAFFILTTNERHLGLRHSLSETQRIFTSSWWTGEPDTLPRREQQRRRVARDAFDGADLHVTDGVTSAPAGPSSVTARLRRRWLPASFIRFVWFCLALLVGLLAYVIGEAYAEIYLRTLPHNNLEAIVYVYGWIVTVYLLDGLTGWILGGNEGERVGSYPLSWIFKLYFMLTYQTYVRALYARLRSPSQFVLLQVLSSTSLIILTPLMMAPLTHRILTLLSLNGQSYGAYQKLCVRNVFIRFLAENCSMLAFLGSVLVLHTGANRDVYPYFAFDNVEVDAHGYNFRLTFIAAATTWACELIAAFVVSGLILFFFGVSVITEGKLDLIVWPELLPTSVAVVLHVLQNMLFSIIRLQFR